MFVVDDVALLIGVIGAALASGASGASLYSGGGNKTTRTYTNPKTGKKIKVKLDGKLKGIDPENVIGHIISPGVDYGKAVGENGRLISADDALERLGIGSYDAVKIATALNTGMTRMLNPRGADKIFKKGSKYGNMGDLTKDILKDSDAMKKYVDALLGPTGTFDPSKLSPSKIIEILKNPNNIAPIIQGTPKKYKEIWDIINNKFPKYEIEPTIDEPWTKTKDGDGDGPDKPPIPEPKPIPKKPPKQPKKPDDDGPSKRQPGDDDPDDDPYDPDPEKPDPDKPKPDPKKPKPPKPLPLPTPEQVKEKEIELQDKKKPPRQRIPQKWYPEYKFGGQNVLKLTDVEKIEHLKNYTLFDLVNPLLAGDKDNLLQIQNQLKEKMRFSNNYPNPKPEARLQPIPEQYNNYGYKMRDTMPVAYPFSLDQPEANNYYDNFCSEYQTELNKTIDSVKRDGTFEPEIAKLANGMRRTYTATDNNIMRHAPGVKMSLLEGMDSTNINPLDLMLLR